MTSRRHRELTMITCSVASDLQRTERLCRSVDRWVSASVIHWIVVPARDLPHFRKLSNGRRGVLAIEDCVPGKFWQVSSRWWLENRAWPVRDSILEQVTKLSANFISGAESIVFADSDLQFVRPFSVDSVTNDGELRLQRSVGMKRGSDCLQWHHKAADLIAVKRRHFGHDYSGPLVTWRRTHLIELQRHLENQHDRPWYQSVGRARTLSGYTLYGAYIEAVLGIDKSDHFACRREPVHSCWVKEEADALDKGAAPIHERAVAVRLQSDLGPWTLRSYSHLRLSQPNEFSVR